MTLISRSLAQIAQPLHPLILSTQKRSTAGLCAQRFNQRPSTGATASQEPPGHHPTQGSFPGQRGPLFTQEELRHSGSTQHGLRGQQQQEEEALWHSAGPPSPTPATALLSSAELRLSLSDPCILAPLPTHPSRAKEHHLAHPERRALLGRGGGEAASAAQKNQFNPDCLSSRAGHSSPSPPPKKQFSKKTHHLRIRHHMGVGWLRGLEMPCPQPLS